MNTNRLDAIGYIDSQLIEKADNYKRIKSKHKWMKPVVIAACVCLAVGFATAAAATGFGTRLIDIFNARQTAPGVKESGYDLGIEIARTRTDDLSKEIQNVSNKIKQQYKDYREYDNWFPSEWQTEFYSRDEACKFLGIKQIKTLDTDWKEQGTTLDVFGDENGTIDEINIETTYQIDDIFMQFITTVYTENYDEEITQGTITEEDVEFTESSFTTKQNYRCQVIASSALESGYQCMDGYIVVQGVLYNLHIAYLEKDASQATELLHQWADMI